MMTARFLWDRFLFRVRVSGLIPLGGIILDVGTGLNTTTLEMFGDLWEVTPSDINVGDWNAHIPGMIQLDIMNPEEAIGGQPKYDAVILSEVLEHVTDPDSVLYKVWNLLKPGGIVIITCPFFYRIHEYGGDDTETTEPGLKDYWRFTPNGMTELMKRQAFSPFWVGRLVENDIKTFPQFYCPKGVVAWGRMMTHDEAKAQDRVHVAEEAWNPALPADWKEQQLALVAEYERKAKDAGRVEPI